MRRCGKSCSRPTHRCRKVKEQADALRLPIDRAHHPTSIHPSLPAGCTAADIDGDEERFLAGAALEIRRLCNLALAFIRQVHMPNSRACMCVGGYRALTLLLISRRQDLRESRFGFLTGTELEARNTPFDADTFVLDPVRCVRLRLR